MNPQNLFLLYNNNQLQNYINPFQINNNDLNNININNLTPNQLLQIQYNQLLYNQFIQNLNYDNLNNNIIYGPYAEELQELIQFNKKQQRILNQKKLEELFKDEDDILRNYKILSFKPKKEEYEELYNEKKKKIELDEKNLFNLYDYIKYHLISKDNNNEK